MKSDSEDEDEDGNESYPEASASGNAKMDLKGGWERARDNDGNRNEDGDGRMVGLEETLGQTDEGNPSMAHWQLDSMSDNGGGVSVPTEKGREAGREAEGEVFVPSCEDEMTSGLSMDAVGGSNGDLPHNSGSV